MSTDKRRPLVVDIGLPSRPAFTPTGPHAPGAPASGALAGLPGRPVLVDVNGFRLRTLTAADATPGFLAWMSDPRILAGLNLAHLSFTLESLAQFIARFDNWTHYLIGIFDIDSNTLVGFYTVDVERMHRVGMLTLGLGDTVYEGRGVIRLTMDALLDEFFDRQQVDKVSSRVVSRNWRVLSNLVMRNERFFYEGKLRKECIGPDGKRVDLLVFSAFKGEQMGPNGMSVPWPGPSKPSA